MDTLLIPISQVMNCLGIEDIFVDVNNSEFLSENISFPINDEISHLMSSMYDASNLTSSMYNIPMATSSSESSLFWIRSRLRQVVVPILCCIGLAGHVTTMFLTSCGRCTTAGYSTTERAVHIWLRAIAVSGMLFCITLLPYGLIRENLFSFESVNFELLYLTYNEAIINTAIMTSTWLAVVMAVQRYLFIVHPFQFTAPSGRSTARVLMVITASSEVRVVLNILLCL